MALFKKAAATKMWFQDFEIGLLSWPSNSSKESLRSHEATYRKYRWR